MSLDYWETIPFSTIDSTSKTVGPLTLTVSRNGNEWLVEHERSAPSVDNGDVAPPITAKKTERYVVGRSFETVTFHPVLPDRSVITRPETPLAVPPGQEIALYVSVPLWVSIQIGKEKIQLSEIPIIRLSDSFFGSSTTSGELCYAGKTRARLSSTELSTEPYRAIIRVSVTNSSRVHLMINHLNLPLPILSLFKDEHGRFWIQPLKINKKSDVEDATVEPTAPLLNDISGPSLVNEPRNPAKNKTVIGIIGSYFTK